MIQMVDIKDVVSAADDVTRHGRWNHEEHKTPIG